MGIRSTLLAVVFVSVMSLGGCVSFSTGTPLYDRKEAVIDPTLLGVWGNEEMRLTIDLAPNYGMSTRWELFDPKNPGEAFDFGGFLPTDFVRFGGYTYLFPYLSPSDYWAATYMVMYRMDQAGDALMLSQFEGSELLRRLGSGNALPQAMCAPMTVMDSDGELRQNTWHTRVSLNGADLRAYLIEHEDDADLFTSLPPLRRVR